MPAVSPTLWVPVLNSGRGGGAAVAGVALLGGAVDLQVEAPGVAVGLEVLDHLDRARLAGVGDRADDVLVRVQGDVQRVLARGRALVASPFTQLIDFS